MIDFYNEEPMVIIPLKLYREIEMLQPDLNVAQELPSILKRSNMELYVDKNGNIKIRGIRKDEAQVELISREDAMEAIRAIKEVMLTNGEVINALYQVPTIESRPQGKWIDREGKETKSKYCGYCSECGGWSEYLTDFCGNCGADMRCEE